MKKTSTTAIIIALIITVPHSSQAFLADMFKGCPDEIRCRAAEVYDFGSRDHIIYHYLGTIRVSTCFSLMDLGCRPWNCDNENKGTNTEHWRNECKNQFSQRLDVLKKEGKYYENSDDFIKLSF